MGLKWCFLVALVCLLPSNYSNGDEGSSSPGVEQMDLQSYLTL